MSRLIFFALLIASVLFFLGSRFQFQLFNQNTEATLKQLEKTISKNNIVEIKDFTFSPNEITIRRGEKVTFVNRDRLRHSATADDGSFDTQLLEQNESKTLIFSNQGAFSYHSTTQPYIKATVIVE